MQQGGTSILGLLGVLFIALKLLGITQVAAWSWWLVLMPFWIGLAIAVVFMFIGAVLMLAAYVFGK